MFAWLLGWSKWQPISTCTFSESRTHYSPDPGDVHGIVWRAEGIRVLMRRRNRRTGLVQYRYREYLK